MFLIKKLFLPLRGFKHPFSYIDPFIKLEKDDTVLEIGVGDGYALLTNAEKV